MTDQPLPPELSVPEEVIAKARHPFAEASEMFVRNRTAVAGLDRSLDHHRCCYCRTLHL